MSGALWVGLPRRPFADLSGLGAGAHAVRMMKIIHQVAIVEGIINDFSFYTQMFSAKNLFQGGFIIVDLGRFNDNHSRFYLALLQRFLRGQRTGRPAGTIQWITTGGRRFSGSQSASAKAPSGRRSSGCTSRPCYSAVTHLALPRRADRGHHHHERP
jgi:hypothetical protein